MLCDRQVGRDPRITGPLLAAALVAGLTSKGVRVARFGLATTPAMFMSCITAGAGCSGLGLGSGLSDVLHGPRRWPPRRPYSCPASPLVRGVSHSFILKFEAWVGVGAEGPSAWCSILWSLCECACGACWPAQHADQVPVLR